MKKLYIKEYQYTNKNSVQFIFNEKLSDNITLFFTKYDNFINSEIATILFKLDFVQEIMISENTILITKIDEEQWTNIFETLHQKITGYIDSQNNNNSSDQEENIISIISQIKELIDIRIKPALDMHGGSITFKDYKDGIVFVEMHGSCSECPSATITLKSFVENLLKYYIPEIQEVRA